MLKIITTKSTTRKDHKKDAISETNTVATNNNTYHSLKKCVKYVGFSYKHQVFNIIKTIIKNIIPPVTITEVSVNINFKID